MGSFRDDLRANSSECLSMPPPGEPNGPHTIAPSPLSPQFCIQIDIAVEMYHTVRFTLTEGGCGGGGNGGGGLETIARLKLQYFSTWQVLHTFTLMRV